MKSDNSSRSVFQLVAMSTERIQKHANQPTNEFYLQSIKKGSIPLAHPDLHEFVNRVHDANQPIYLRHYVPGKLRAAQSQSDFVSGHLEIDAYQKRQNPGMRDEIVGKQKLPLRYGMNPRTENERVREQLHSLQVDHSIKDTSMIHHPEWKPVDKDKWVSDQTFKSQAGNFENKAPWRKIPVRLEQDNNIYIDKEDTFKSTKAVSNIGKPPFNPTIKKNPYTTLSQSIRTFKQDQAFGNNDNKEMYSSNDKLNHYKTALIKTKSMDYVLPYNHSNNFQQVKNIWPNQGKQYLKSMEQLSYQYNVESLQSLKSDSQLELDQINEYPKTADKKNANFEKTNFFGSKVVVSTEFKPYSDDEAKQIVGRYFRN